MNIIKKIQEEKCSISELIALLEESNPIIIYHTIVCIGKNKYNTKEILEKLTELSSKRQPQDKLIGNYKIGDLALAAIVKLEEKDNKVALFENVDEYEEKMILRLYEEIDW